MLFLLLQKRVNLSLFLLVRGLFSITKYDWNASTFVFSEKPYAYEMEKLDRTLAMLNGEKLYLEEDDLPSISVSASAEIEKDLEENGLIIPETPEIKNKK